MATVSETRILASPLARRLARQAGLALGDLSGSGPHGRVIKRDIEAALRASTRPTAGTAPSHREVTTTVRPSAPSDDKILALYDKGSYEIVPHDKMRRVIAERL